MADEKRIQFLRLGKFSMFFLKNEKPPHAFHSPLPGNLGRF